MVDVGLLVTPWEAPYRRPDRLRLGGAWEGEEPPWMGRDGGGGPGGAPNLRFWDHGQ